MRTVAIIQARMGSTRLRGKSLMGICGEPLLLKVINQVKGSNLVSEVIVVTTNLEEDEPIVELCKKINLRFFRGSKNNVLERYFKAAEITKADIIVRITGDCPLIAPDTIDEVIEGFLKSNCSYVSNTNPYTRSEGQDVEVFDNETLKIAYKNANEEIDLEHVTLYMKKDRLLSKKNIKHCFYKLSDLKLSVDYIEDLNFVREVWSNLEKNLSKKEYYTYKEIIMALHQTKREGKTFIVNDGLYLSILKSCKYEKTEPLTLTKSFKLLEESDKFIPGGAQTYSKSWRPHIKGVSPIFLKSGKGSIVYDVDDNEFVDLIQGLLPNILGYANEHVNNAVMEVASKGHSFSLPHELEISLAKKLCQIIPCAEKVRFGKNGSDATAGAVRVARAFTGRENVAVCGYHGWQDWFIGSTSRKAGVPKGTIDLVHNFKYNDLLDLEKVLSSRKDQFAAVILEPVNFFWPNNDYLQKVKEITHKHGALLIFDEICSGFHFGIGGAQKLFGVMPDLATFGKAMGNGWPISCIVGRSDIMQVFEDAFFSFTFAGDVASIAAALKVIEILEDGKAYENMRSAGKTICDGAKVMAEASGLANMFKLDGHHNWSIFDFVNEKGQSDPAIKTLWIQELTRNGVLILTTLNVSASMDQYCINKVLKAFAKGFNKIKQCREENINPIDLIDGPIPIPAFRAR